MEDFKHAAPNDIICQAEELFCDEPFLVCPNYKTTADSILATLGKRAPTNFYEALEIYFILILVFDIS